MFKEKDKILKWTVFGVALLSFSYIFSGCCLVDYQIIINPILKWLFLGGSTWWYFALSISLFLPLSLISLFFHIDIFLSWWKVARWGVCFVILSVLLSAMSEGDVFGDMIAYMAIVSVAGGFFGLSSFSLIKQACVTYWDIRFPLWVSIMLFVVSGGLGLFGGYHLFKIIV